MTNQPPNCFQCRRPLRTRIEWHHPIPKSKGGRETATVHPICHRTIDAVLSNNELERDYTSAEALRAHPEIAKFILWVRDKDPDFHAPTRRRQG